MARFDVIVRVEYDTTFVVDAENEDDAGDQGEALAHIHAFHPNEDEYLNMYARVVTPVEDDVEESAS